MLSKMLAEKGGKQGKLRVEMGKMGENGENAGNWEENGREFSGSLHKHVGDDCLCFM